MKELNINIQEKDLELIVSEKTLGCLTTNAKQIKSLVESALPNYDISNYNEGNIDHAKKDKAMLNKASKTLNAKRLEIEKEFMKPFTEFKEVVNDTVKLISECSLKIDSVVKENDQKAKNEKRTSIQSYFDEKKFNLVSFEKIFEEKWLNKTFKDKDIHSEIEAKIIKIKDDLVTLEAIGQDVDLLKSLYLDTLNLNNTIQYANTLKENRERVKVEASVLNPEAQIPKVQEVQNPSLFIRAFKVTGTRDDIIALSEFMNSRGIKFEKLEL
ncbi:DUF1351 domain-containing protein [uncultured Bacteroides sp.]|uniref:DUF1351 domain-containing protein n=1 Tax=uncultured Bacteroides sp. TaxID=162156 RepID=UPI002AAAD9F9|nr:DUF1351 domain-containing protein [uncultured Bacteroides sp.]